MVRRFTVSSVAVVTLFFLLSEAYSAGTKRGQSLFERLVEIKTVDENGRVTARMVAESSTEGRTQRHSNEDYEETSDTDEQIDDEDARAVSSGSSERNGGEDGDFSIAHDEPVSSGNGSFSPAEQISDHNITKKPVTPSGSSNVSNPVTTTTPPPSVVTSPSNTSTIIPNTTPENTTIAAPQTIATDPVTTTPNTTTPNTTTPNTTVTVSPSTTVAATRQPSMTSVTETGTQTTTINFPTTKPGNATNITVMTDKPMDLSTEKLAVSTHILNTGPVQANRDPTERRRKTLFGFVTIEILIALLAGALFSILLVAFLVYRLKKRNEGSYELSETIALRPKELDEMGKKKEVFV